MPRGTERIVTDDPTSGVVRAARVDDAEALGEVLVTSWLAAYRGIMPDSTLARLEPVSKAEMWRKLIGAAPTDDPSRRWVVEVDGDVVGYAITIPGSDEFLPPPAGSGEIDSLYLRPDAQGRGLGRALLEHSVMDLRERGFEPLVLWAFEANDHARRFYERLGWRFDGSRQHWVLDDVPVPVVRYRLGTPG
jgi:ribosomal protein S18 acetylase RimI-like enzyme